MFGHERVPDGELDVLQGLGESETRSQEIVPKVENFVCAFCRHESHDNTQLTIGSDAQ